MRRASHWPVRGLRLLSALGSKTLPCVKNYIRVEKRGLVRSEGSSGRAGEVKGSCYVYRQPSQAACGGAVGTKVTTAALAAWLSYFTAEVLLNLVT